MSSTPEIECTIDRLQTLLAGPLPGPEAQQAMAVRPRTVRPAGPDAQATRWSAVLILLYPLHGQLALVLIRRSSVHRHHPGQVGLPGGGREAGDASLWHTALREASEEIGIAPTHVRRLGALSVLDVPVSANMVQPYVGYLPDRPAFRLQPDEVEAVVELPLWVLLADEARSEEEWQLPGRLARVPFFRYQDAIIWGATAMILSELSVLLSRIEQA